MRAFIILALGLALVLTACGGSPSPDAAPAATERGVAQSPVPSASASVEPVAEAASEAPVTSPEYEECIANRKASDKEIGAAFDEEFAQMVCADMDEVLGDYDEQMAEYVAETPVWECWLDLEEARPELFVSADPEVYGNDPEVVAVCGGK